MVRGGRVQREDHVPAEMTVAGAGDIHRRKVVLIGDDEPGRSARRAEHRPGDLTARWNPDVHVEIDVYPSRRAGDRRDGDGSRASIRNGRSELRGRMHRPRTKAPRPSGRRISGGVRRSRRCAPGRCNETKKSTELRVHIHARCSWQGLTITVRNAAARGLGIDLTARHRASKVRCSARGASSPRKGPCPPASTRQSIAYEPPFA